MVSVAESDWRRYVRPTVGNQVLWLLCLMYFLYYIDRVNIATAAPLIKADLGLSNTELGAAFGAFAAPYTIFQLIGGWLGDRLGPRRTLGIGGVIVCAATALTGLVGGLQSLSNARLLLGIGEGAAFPTATRAMSAWLPREQWAYAQGITHCFARIGNALTPPLIALLIGLVSWRGSFVVMGGVSLIWVAVWVWFFRDDPRRHPAMSDAERAQMPPERGATRASLDVTYWLRLAGRIAPVTAVDFCYGWTLWLFLTWVPSFFYSAYHLDLKHSAAWSATGCWRAPAICASRATGSLRSACSAPACSSFRSCCS